MPSSKKGKTQNTINPTASYPNAVIVIYVKDILAFVCNDALMWYFLGLQGKAPEAEDRK